jgi:hypothetical protein
MNERVSLRSDSINASIAMLELGEKIIFAFELSRDHFIQRVQLALEGQSVNEYVESIEIVGTNDGVQ